MARTRGISCLHEEMIFIILSLLPVKSLLLLKSVCKLWLAILSDPKFIQAQLTHTKKKQACIPCTALAVEHNKLYLVDSIQGKVRFRLRPQLNRSICFFGSCNGLVCHADKNCDNMCIWNLWTNCYKILPALNKQIISRHLFTVGFGFDSICNDYKLLRLLIHPDEPDNGTFTCKLEAEMYSANADSWKEIRLPEELSTFFPYRHVHHAINGVLYIQGSKGVMSFDLHDEGLRVYPYTNSMCSIRKSDVLDFEGSAALIRKSIGDKSVLSLWTLDDVCDNVSWTKKFNLELDGEIDRVYCYLGAGQFVVLRHKYEVHICDYKKKETQKLAHRAPPVYKSASYIESLASLKGFQQQETPTATSKTTPNEKKRVRFISGQ